jgi:exodeoxyribonuclease VII large subunit
LRVRPAQQLKQRRESLQLARRRLRDLSTARWRELRTSFTKLEHELRLLGPEQVLARGYSITTDATTGKVLRDAALIKRGQRLKTRLKSGKVRSVAEG